MNTEYLDDVIPGRAEYRAEEQAQRAELDRISREIEKPAQKALAALCFGSRDNDGNRRKRPEVPTADFDAAHRALLDAKALYEAQLQRVQNPPTAPTGDPALVRAAHACEAVRQHARAAEAWTAVQSALTARETAARLAGSPGRPWTTHRSAKYGQIDGGAGDAASVITAQIEGFDTDATQAVADGGEAAPFRRIVTSPDGGSRQDLAFHSAPTWNDPALDADPEY